MGQHLYTFINPVNDKHMNQVCECLNRDGIIAYPTDINWAFACIASSSKALDRIHRLKPAHPKERPFSLICADISMASEITQIDTNVYRHLRKALPGPYTILLTASKTLPRQIHDKRRVVGLRIPDHALILEITRRLGKPIATTSVPPVPQLGSDELAPPSFGWQVHEHFGHALDITLDLGDELPHGESTIIDMTSEVPHLIRLGLGDPSIFADLVDARAEAALTNDSEEN